MPALDDRREYTPLNYETSVIRRRPAPTVRGTGAPQSQSSCGLAERYYVRTAWPCHTRRSHSERALEWWSLQPRASTRARCTIPVSRSTGLRMALGLLLPF